MLKKTTITIKRIVFNKLILRVAKVIMNLNRENEWQKLKLEFKSIGEITHVNNPYSISNPSYISIGKNFHSGHHLRLEAINKHNNIQYNPTIQIGDYVSIESNCHIGAINKIIIGNNVLIASNVYISDHSHGDTSGEYNDIIPFNRPLISKGPVIIEDNVWIGQGVSILPNVTIGFNAIIGANSVVTKSVQPNSVVGGIPAKLIKYLK